MPNLQGVLTYDDTIDEQVQDPLLLGEGGFVQARTDALTEGRYILPDVASGGPLGMEPRLLIALGQEELPAPLELLPTAFELIEVQNLRLISIEETLLFTVEPPQVSLPLVRRGFLIIRLSLCLVCERLELSQQGRGVTQELANVVPDRGIEFLNLGEALRTPTRAIPADAIAPVTLVIAMGPRVRRRAGDAKHG